MTPQENIAQMIKTLRTQARDNLAMADYLETVKALDATPEPKKDAE